MIFSINVRKFDKPSSLRYEGENNLRNLTWFYRIIFGNNPMRVTKSEAMLQEGYYLSISVVSAFTKILSHKLIYHSLKTIR